MASALAARDAGVMFSLDLASFEVVRDCEAALNQILSTGCVDVVFCNEDEAEAVCKISGTWPGVAQPSPCLPDLFQSRATHTLSRIEKFYDGSFSLASGQQSVLSGCDIALPTLSPWCL